MSKLIVANLKMNMDYKTTLEYVENVNENIVICPSYIYIPYFLNKYKVGAQDCFNQKKGSYTGGISPFHLKEMGVEYVIIGHSERRKFEDDIFINQKIKVALDSGLKVILCIGENVSEDKFEKLSNQINNDLKDVSLDNLILAYEPIWAIGTGVIPTNEKIEETTTFIKKIVKDKFNKEISVLYGGSVNTGNIELLNKIKNVDGYLIGTASLNYNEINKIYNISN